MDLGRLYGKKKGHTFRVRKGAPRVLRRTRENIGPVKPKDGSHYYLPPLVGSEVRTVGQRKEGSVWVQLGRYLLSLQV